MHNLYKDGAAHAQASSATSGSVGAVEFMKALFEHTTAPVYVCSFPNERDDPKQAGERHIATRLPSHISSFVEKWDKPGRGLFFGVGTVNGDKRKKENIVETIGLHVDIDFNKVDSLPSDNSKALTEVMRHLARLKYLPSITVFSGNGVHAYWLFKEPMPTQGNIERIELALRQLADHVAGDLPVCEVSRVLRLPETHNTKSGAWDEVEVTSFDPERRYELDDLEEWLSEASPVMLRKKREHAFPAGETDFFAEFAKQHGIKAPIDVEARLAAMMFMGGEDSSIHQTQLAVSAALLNKGVPVDEVVAILMDATRRAAGEYSARWNWRREERKIRGMCSTWLKKHPPEQPKAASKATLKSIEGGKVETRCEPQQQDQQQTAGGAQVIQMPPKSVPAVVTEVEQHVSLGRAVLAQIAEQGNDLISIRDGMWFYSRGLWELRTEAKWLDVRIESACRGLRFKNSTKLINDTRNWIIRNPDIWREDELPWDQHGKIPTRSGLIDPRTGTLEPARPDHFCTWRVEVDYDPAAKCPWWEIMIADVFGDRDPAEQSALDQLLAALGRSEEHDHRIAVHEAGHAVAARLLGHPLGGATVDPGPGYEGRIWGERYVEAFSQGRGDASDVRGALAPMMPKAGEDRSSVSDVFENVYAHCIELMAGRAAERMLLEDEPAPPADDLRQARELGLLICSSEEAIETFIAHCDVAARDLLLPYGDVMMTLSIVLRIKRTLDAAEIDKIIADLQARKAQAIEHRRRADWRKRELAAASFHGKCHHPNAAPPSHFAPDRLG